MRRRLRVMSLAALAVLPIVACTPSDGGETEPTHAAVSPLAATPDIESVDSAPVSTPASDTFIPMCDLIRAADIEEIIGLDVLPGVDGILGFNDCAWARESTDTEVPDTVVSIGLQPATPGEVLDEWSTYANWREWLESEMGVSTAEAQVAGASSAFLREGQPIVGMIVGDAYVSVELRDSILGDTAFDASLTLRLAELVVARLLDTQSLANAQDLPPWTQPPMIVDSVSSVVADSQNITCGVEEGSLLCVILESTYPLPERPEGFMDGPFGNGIGMDPDGVPQWFGVGDVPFDPLTAQDLEVGEGAQMRGLIGATCVAIQGGIRCDYGESWFELTRDAVRGTNLG